LALDVHRGSIPGAPGALAWDVRFTQSGVFWRSAEAERYWAETG
jgi:hypothetical protein